MVRVLQVFGKLNRGGAETMIMNYYRNINRDKVQFDFVVNFREEGAYEEEIRSLGGTIYRVPRFKGYNIIPFLSAWYRLLKKHKEWQVIHIHNFKVAGLIFPVAKMLGRKKRIVHMHTANPTYTASRRLGYELTKMLANHYATDLLACGEDAGKCYYGDRNYTVINNAIDAKRFVVDSPLRDKIREEFGFSGSDYVVGHVGNFSKVKNHSFIVEVFDKVRNECSSAKLLLVGDGAERKNIEQLVADKGLEDAVIFTGSRGDVPELMMAMDFFIFPSLFEGLPVTIVEAQASGLHIVMSEGITKEVVVTPLVDILPLSVGSDEWAQVILRYKDGYVRDDISRLIADSGFDVYDNIKYLEKLYI